MPNAYVKADKEKDLDIYMKVPRGIQLNQDVLNKHGVKETPCSAAEEITLRFEASRKIVEKATAFEVGIELNFKQCTTDM